MSKRLEFIATMDSWNEKPANKIEHIFRNVSLANGHKGLVEIARKAGRDPGLIPPGRYLVFVNKKVSAFKILNAYGTTIAHFKMPGDGRLELRTIQYLPKFFSGEKINYLGALREVLEKTTK